MLYFILIKMLVLLIFEFIYLIIIIISMSNFPPIDTRHQLYSIALPSCPLFLTFAYKIMKCMNIEHTFFYSCLLKAKMAEIMVIFFITVSKWFNNWLKKVGTTSKCSITILISYLLTYCITIKHHVFKM